MKKIALLVLTMLFMQNLVLSSDFSVYKDKNKFGLKDSNSDIVVEANFNKLIKLGEKSWLVQKGSRFGIMNSNGEFIVNPKFSKAERILRKYAKLCKGDKCGLYDEYGMEVLPVEYSSIGLLYGGMFLTCKNYKYGLVDSNGQLILDNLFDDIYMPQPNVMVLSYNGHKYEIENVNSKELTIPTDASSITSDDNIKITEIIQKPATATGYYSVTATNYFLKVFSSISTAYEDTIDELMFHQGADAANAIIRFSWLPKFPFVYAKKYYQNLVAPNNGPLQEVKVNLKNQIKN